MKKIILNSLIFLFIVSIKLYCFDDILEDIFDDFEDLFKIVGIIAMIIAVMYFVKKFIRDDNNLNNKNENREYKINYDKKENKEFKIISIQFVYFKLFRFQPLYSILQRSYSVEKYRQIRKSVLKSYR